MKIKITTTAFLQAFLLGILSVMPYFAKAQYYDWRIMNNNLSAYSTYPGNSNIVFAGDVSGLIRRSTNKGVDWQLVSSQSESQINSIAFLNKNKGFATTGELLTTNDGGLTWKRLSFKNSSSSTAFSGIKRIVVIDSLTAFFDCFNHPISAPSKKEALVTRDGGATFSLVTCPGNVYHVKGDTLIAFGREVGQFGLAMFTVYKSIDKGQSWNIVKAAPAGLNNDFNFEGMQLASFKNSNTFYITAYKGDKAMYKTSDGGLSFSVFATPSTEKFKWWHFKNDNEIIGIDGRNGWSYSTTDGGANWTQLNKSLQVPAVTLNDGTILTAEQNRSVITTDFGVTATPQSDPMSTLTSGSDMFFLQVVDDSVSYAAYGISVGVAVDPLLVKTNNKGLTWKKVMNNASFPYYAQTYRFLNTDTFFFAINGAGGNLEIKCSTDGGLTSDVKYTGSWQEKVTEIISIDSKYLVAYTAITVQPAIFVSSDRGLTWVKRSLSFSAGTPYKLSFPNKDAWYEVHQGIVSKSTDQGQTWIDITGTLPAGCASQIHFRDAQNGFVYGNCSPNKLFKTTDGGATWTNISSNNSFTTMTFQDQNTGYASAPLVNTTDGGATWNPYYRAYTGGTVIKIDFDDQATTGAMLSTGYFYSRYMDGEVFVTDSLSYNNQTVGINDQTPNEFGGIKIYPNPVSKTFTLINQTITNALLDVSVYDHTGRLVYSQTKQSLPTQIDATDFASGMYIVTTKDADGAVYYTKFTKE